MPTIKELHEAIRQYNATSCVKGYSGKKKAELLQIVNRMGQKPTASAKAVGATPQKKQKKKIKPTLVGSGSGMTFGAKKKKKIKPTLVSAAGSGSGMPFGAPAQGGTEGRTKRSKDTTPTPSWHSNGCKKHSDGLQGKQLWHQTRGCK